LNACEDRDGVNELGSKRPLAGRCTRGAKRDGDFVDEQKADTQAYQMEKRAKNGVRKVDNEAKGDGRFTMR